jgi:hypothetical protein
MGLTCRTVSGLRLARAIDGFLAQPAPTGFWALLKVDVDRRREMFGEGMQEQHCRVGQIASFSKRKS